MILGIFITLLALVIIKIHNLILFYVAGNALEKALNEAVFKFDVKKKR